MKPASLSMPFNRASFSSLVSSSKGRAIGADGVPFFLRKAAGSLNAQQVVEAVKNNPDRTRSTNRFQKLIPGPP